LSPELFEYSPIVQRPPLAWPGGARVAFYVGLNLESFVPGVPSTSIQPGRTMVPDPLNEGWRDYGQRVGVWRIIEALDAVGLPASALLTSDLVERFPPIVAAGLERDWAWLGHGKNLSMTHDALSPDDERAVIAEVAETIERACGTRPRGWMGPGLTASFDTPRLLREAGFDYLLDWTNDDQPYPLSGVPGLLSVPYSVELNDFALFLHRGFTGPEFVTVVRDQLERLARDAENGSGRVMALGLHTFISGQAFRTKYIEEAIAHVVEHPAVWATTSDAIAAHYVSAP
jgi:peptidoglycan/xylan/chitin deacetylase (PgdA/CDA1 family)